MKLPESLHRKLLSELLLTNPFILRPFYSSVSPSLVITHNTLGGYSWLSQQIGNYSGEFFTVACAPVADKMVCGFLRFELTPCRKCYA